MLDVNRIANKVEEAISLPVVINEVIKVASHPGSDAKKIAEVISKDPAFAAKILRTANSSFFSFVSKTNDIDAAVSRLGVKQVRTIALAAGVGKMFKGEDDVEGYSRINLWTHSVAVATMGEMLAKMSIKREAKALASEVLLAGLVHDIGIILADQVMHKNYSEVPALAKQLNSPFFKIEKDRYGFDHAKLGAIVLARWKFPNSIVSAVAGHHKTKAIEEDTMTQLVAMAEFMVYPFGFGFSDIPGVPPKMFSKLQKNLGILGPAILKIKQSFSEKLTEALEIFQDEKKTVEV